MYGYLEITVDAARRLRCRSAYATVLLAILLSGCASFSPDGGMTVVANVAGETIGKDQVEAITSNGSFVIRPEREIIELFRN